MSPYDGADLNSPNWLIQKAKDMYQASSDYLDANITTQWEKNLNHFNNQHASSSKLSAAALKRSKIFRPKTRSMVKGQEAALAVAAFGSENMLIVKPVDSDNEKQRISASITKSLLDYRLKKTIKWPRAKASRWRKSSAGYCWPCRVPPPRRKHDSGFSCLVADLFA